MTDVEQQVKIRAKIDLGSVLAISPEQYKGYIEWSSSFFNVPFDKAKELIKEALNELPPYEG